jgi:hypothetical protein
MTKNAHRAAQARGKEGGTLATLSAIPRRQAGAPAAPRGGHTPPERVPPRRPTIDAAWPAAPHPVGTENEREADGPGFLWSINLTHREPIRVTSSSWRGSLTSMHPRFLYVLHWLLARSPATHGRTRGGHNMRSVCSTLGSVSNYIPQSCTKRRGVRQPSQSCQRGSYPLSDHRSGEQTTGELSARA